MKGSRIAAIAIVGMMMASGFCFLTFNSSNAKAFPTANPQPSEYIFYDDFETSGSILWPNFEQSTGVVTVSTTQAFHNSHSAKFDVYGRNGENIALQRYFSNNTDTRNEGIVVECQFYDNASVTRQNPEVQFRMVVGGAHATVMIGLKLNLTLGQRMYFFGAYDDGWPNGGYKYQVTTHERSTGWHDLKIQLVSHTQYYFYVDNDLVGNLTLTASSAAAGMTYMNVYGAGTYGNPAAGQVWYIDQFLIYPFTQEMPWQRVKLALGNTVPFRSYIAGESTLMYEGGIWKMWYNAMNASDMATGGLGYATSTDGYNWTDYNNVHAPLFSLGYYGFRPHVSKIGSTYYAYYTNESITGHAYAGCHYMRRTSSDGITWSAAVNTNLSAGAALGAWDHVHIGNIDVWQEGVTWYAVYEANSNASSWRTGLATSTDGINWLKSSFNPVTPAGMMAGGPEVHKIGAVYYMLVHGLFVTTTVNTPTDQYLLQSTDLVHWSQSQIFMQLPRLFAASTENYQVADGSYCSDGSKNLLAYTGTISGTDYSQIWIARSAYTLDQIANGQLLQSGNHLIGNLGATNNVTASGKYWYSGINAMKGTYTDNLSLSTTSPVNITLTAMSNVSFAWTANPGTGNPTVNYIISGLSPLTRYFVFVDGSISQTVNANSTGSISFSYIGAGLHLFAITFNRYDANIDGLLYLIPFFLTLGVVMIPLMKVVEISKQKRMLRVDEVIRMFVSIIVGFALVGITYTMI
jgi:hypothetical protein